MNAPHVALTLLRSQLRAAARVAVRTTVPTVMALVGAAVLYGSPAVIVGAVATRADETTHCSPVPLRLVRGLPVATVGVDGVEVELMVDLGGFDAIHLTPSVLEEAGTRFTGRRRRFENALGQKLSAREFRLNRVTLGTHVVENVTVGP